MTDTLRASQSARCGHKQPCSACAPRGVRYPGPYAGCKVVAYHMACSDMARFGYSRRADERCTRLAVEAAGAGAWSGGNNRLT